jgi:hypothetical protein
MKFIPETDVLKSFKYFIDFGARLNTSTLVGLLALFKNGTLLKNKYLSTDMTGFSSDLNRIVNFQEEENQPIVDKTWFILFHHNWIREIKSDLLEGKKINLQKAALLYYWNTPFYKPTDVVKEFRKDLPTDFLEEFFIDTSETFSLANNPPDKNNLYQSLGGTGKHYTLDLDKGSFIKKKPWDLSGAPYAQTLYANKILRKYFTPPHEFDFLDHYGLEISKYNGNRQGSTIVISESSIRNFALKIFEYFYGNRWLSSIIKKSERSEGNIETNNFDRLKFGPFTGLLGEFPSEQTKESLTSSGDLRFFEDPVFYDEENFYYFSTQWNGNGNYALSFVNLQSFFESEFDCKLNFADQMFTLETQPNIQQKNTQVLPKPFLLLAGISGTGKTRFVRQQAKAHDVGAENFCVVPVRPDWHEPSDLLGYISRIGERPEYVSTKVIQFIIEAWRAIAPNASTNGTGVLNTSSPPYWLCFDEMNLAPVEQYFADYLSALESRKFTDGEYTCDPLLDKSILNTKGADMRSDLGLNDDQGLWDFFLNNGIAIPPNLILAGTVNMDETTHGFSRKVIDRALTIDFGEFFPNDFDKIYGGQDVPKIFTYGMISETTGKEVDSQVDSNGLKTINFLKEVNSVLQNTPFELAYRALNELLLYVHSFSPKDAPSLQAVWDDFLMMKVLPRIDGDDDKLRITTGENHENLLDKLEEVVSEQLSEIWSDKRIDLFRERNGSDINDIPCRSRKKIKWMKERLDRNTFTSYWP